MKKSQLFFCTIALIALVLPGCKQDEGGVDSSWLVGTWANAGAEFTIASNFTFVCDLVSLTPGDSIPARVRGELSKAMSGLSIYQFHLKDLAGGAPGDPNSSYDSGNAILRAVLPTFPTLIAALTPNATSSEFTFSSIDPIAEQFFGAAGPFVKKTGN